MNFNQLVGDAGRNIIVFGHIFRCLGLFKGAGHLGANLDK